MFNRIRQLSRVRLLAVVAFLTLVGWWLWPSAETETAFRTVPVTRGDLVVSVSATGTLEPEEVIDVGAQVAGLILALGTDQAGKSVDYGSLVEAGTVLAKIDESLYLTDVQNARAQVLRAKADVTQSRVKAEQTERDWKRAELLKDSEALAQTAFDAYRFAHQSAQAAVAVAEAEVERAAAVLARAERNLALCTIVSPVRGVIIDRRVNIGQTVVANLNAPSLFLLAKDLTKMQVWVSVNEADIGLIREGQRVTFSVDAFPGEEFQGSVGKIRLNATMSQNVVTYIVEVVTDNSSGRLLPYLTANARFEVSNDRDVLLVPNSALRWSPDPSTVPERSAPKDASALAKNPNQRSATKRGEVWTWDGSTLAPIPVTVHGTDGFKTEVRGEGIREGVPVVVGTEATTDAPQEVNNPFAPKMIRRSNR